MWVVPGTGIGIRARAATLKACSMPTVFPRNSSRSGCGPNNTLLSPKSWGMQITWQIVLTFVVIFSSTRMSYPQHMTKVLSAGGLKPRMAHLSQQFFASWRRAVYRRPTRLISTVSGHLQVMSITRANGHTRRSISLANKWELSAPVLLPYSPFPWLLSGRRTCMYFSALHTTPCLRVIVICEVIPKLVIPVEELTVLMLI